MEQHYQDWAGKRSDHKLLVRFTHEAYQELCPQAKLGHLSQTVEQLWSDQLGLWFIKSTLPEFSGQALGCLWLGNAVDQVSGDRYAHIFLLYVTPAHRRRGLGTALMQRAEQWALQQGSLQLGLHVFVENLSAQALYQRLGYSPKAIFLQKCLNPTNEKPFTSINPP